jgi:hypothetical protein
MILDPIINIEAGVCEEFVAGPKVDKPALDFARG